MFAIIDTKTLKIVGQCLAIYPEDGKAFVPIEKALYRKMMEDPKLYREYRGVKSDNPLEPHKILFVPRMSFSEVRIADVREGEADTWIEVSKTHVTLKSVHGMDPLEVMAFLDGKFENPVMHRELAVEVPVEHEVPVHTRLKFYISKPAIGYKYGVKYT